MYAIRSYYEIEAVLQGAVGDQQLVAGEDGVRVGLHGLGETGGVGGGRMGGFGRVNGEFGLKGYCQTQSIVIDRLGSRREPIWSYNFV